MEERVLIIIPSYNEEKSIAGVVMGLRQAAPDFDRVIVNDGSQDATADVVDRLGEKQLRLPCNLGYGRALQTGMKYALVRGYDIVVSIDADGQHQPEDVPRLVETLRKSGAGMVIGSRFCDGRYRANSFSRRVGQSLFSYLTRLLLGRRIFDTSSGFKALSAAACEVIAGGTFMDFHLETIVQLSLWNFKIVEIPIAVKERTSGKSMHSIASAFHYPLKTLLLTMVTAVDVLLIRRVR